MFCNFSSVFFVPFLVSKTLNPESEPDSDSREMLDPDPDPKEHCFPESDVPLLPTGTPYALGGAWFD
jgi:hypothetical protein